MLVNHTPFPADVFEAIDQYDQKFHVFVLRQTLSFLTGKLEYADKQAPLCDRDDFFDGSATGSVRQESDYCAYKPRCDVIVNAFAHAPKEKPAKHFLVCLRVLRADLKMIEKVLQITGERYFRKKNIATRVAHRLIRWGTLFICRPNLWQLTDPVPFSSLPLRAEYAYGGQCRINVDDAAARRVPAKYRLTDQQRSNHPDAQAGSIGAPVAHGVFESNTVGRGYAPSWYLNSSRICNIPAPRIERAGMPITARQFCTTSLATHPSVIEDTGLGVRSKLHPARRNLLGKIDDDFLRTNRTLPGDFDFRIWNAAHEDQQTDFLIGGDVIELINLVPHGTTGLISDKHGNSVFRLRLPSHQCFVRMKSDDGTRFDRPLAIDTVIVEPEDCSLTLVWRATIPCDEVATIVSWEFRMRSLAERDRARCNVGGRETTYATNELGKAVAP